MLKQQPVLDLILRQHLVRKAAIYMDGLKPDWYLHIDPLTLNLETNHSCICGQNDLRWNTTLAGLPHGAVSCQRRDEPLWLEEIAKRMPVEAPVEAPVPVLV